MKGDIKVLVCEWLAKMQIITSACFTGRTKLINAYESKAFYIQRDKIEIKS